MINVNDEQTSIFVKPLETLMTNKGWVANRCNHCERLFYSKDSQKSQCGWRKCKAFTGERLNPAVNKKQIKPAVILSKIRNLFIDLGYEKHDSINMTEGMNTDLVSAGVQIFSENLLSGDVKDKAGVRYFVSQPCVRLGSIRSHGDLISPDMSSSFVNICTESLGLDVNKHLSSVDDWITILSKIGLHASKINLIVKDRVEDWGTREFLVHQVFFVYDSVEIGDANFTFSLPNCNHVSMSDIGFGLERISWVANGLSNYSDVFCDLGSSSDFQLQDACRTISLLILSEVKPSGRGAGGRLRWLIKRAMTMSETANILSLVYFYLDFWKEFSGKRLDYDSMARILSPECDYLIIRDMCLEFGVNHKSGLSLIELIEILVYNRGQDPKLVKQLISQKRNEKK